MKKENITSSPTQTKKLAEKIARKIIKKGPRAKAFIIGLKGDLGGGKTTFVQGFAKGLGIKEKILSPTFVIYRRYHIPSLKETRPLERLRLSAVGGQKSGEVGSLENFYHFDCYRIKNPKEILDLRFKEIISDSKNIVIIEWADKIQKIMPQNTLWLDFEFMNQSTRKIIFL